LKDMTMEELVEEDRRLCADPANAGDAGGLYLHNEKTRKKLDQIARLIADKVAERRAARGEKINTEGYSGRQTNRRR